MSHCSSMELCFESDQGRIEKFDNAPREEKESQTYISMRTSLETRFSFLLHNDYETIEVDRLYHSTTPELD